MHALATIVVGFPLVATLASNPPQLNGLAVLGLVVFLNGVVYAWASSYQIDISATHFTYRRFLRRTQSIPLDRIADARLEIDFKSLATPARPAVQLLIDCTDRPTLSVNAKAFNYDDVQFIRARYRKPGPSTEAR